MSSTSTNTPQTLFQRLKETFIIYLPLAFITFGLFLFLITGGPAAHIALFHDLFVEKLNWISDYMFIELFAIAQSLPGPASTQLAYCICLLRHGIIPAIASFFIWSLPGMTIMIGLAIGVETILGNSIQNWVYGLENGLVSSAVGLVALAAYKLGNKILVDSVDQSLSLVAIIFAINYTTLPWLFPALMIFGGVISLSFYKYEAYKKRKNLEIRAVSIQVVDNDNAAEGRQDDNVEERQEWKETLEIKYSMKIGIVILIVWLILLIASILIRIYSSIRALNIFATFYFVGSIIFGGYYIYV
jgi:chromate transport protein ChrA